ncbi:hypothetical protein OH710_24505 [Pseudomonas capsici]|uniref:hypothetical protein n=1 Tax=Pseudomonas capsici TaxID=2810614 RepID=UPI0021F1FF42|nr:hypothetical protein [Pseudomonas capsici]MCV4275809.1 hypothetical protein [Pseudomonas capsici]
MPNTASGLSAELKRQIVSQLPARALIGGGLHRFTLKASVKSALSSDAVLNVYATLLQQLAEECPEWAIEIEGELGDLKVTFSR